MKKLVLAAIMMLVPFSAFALDSMTDDALDKMTAQEGVTITFENVTIHQEATNMGWTDGDGLGATSNAASAGTVFIAQSGSTTTEITGSLTIDVATATANMDVDGIAGNDILTGTSFVKIGLPSIDQTAVAKTMTISLNNTVAASTTQVLGSLYQAGGATSIDPGSSVYILAH